MIFKKQIIKGVFLITPDLHKDNRGVFRRHFCKKEFSKNGISSKIIQANISENKFKHTLRGFHYQTGKYSEGKIVSCIKGEIYDIVVDLRKESKTYMKWESVTLDSDKRNALYVPPGCANAYLTIVSNTIVHYYMSELYAPNSYQGFSYKDPEFNFMWPADVKHISQKDENLPNYLESIKQKR